MGPTPEEQAAWFLVRLASMDGEPGSGDEVEIEDPPAPPYEHLSSYDEAVKEEDGEREQTEW